MNAPNPAQPEVYTWSDLTSYWDCPRAWSYGRLGFRPAQMNDAIVRGSLVHAGIRAHWLQLPIRDALAAAVQEGQEEQAKRLLPESLDLINRYIAKYGQDIVPVAVDRLYLWPYLVPVPALPVAGGHPDLVGFANGKLVIAEHKTAGNPDLPFLDHMQQVDWYALLVAEATQMTPQLVYIDVISPDYITRIERPPKLAQAQYVWYRLQELMTVSLKDARAEPHYGYHCRSCWFFKPCQTLDRGLSDRGILDSLFVVQPERNVTA